ncbi:MAG: DnaJ domain-containing protein [Xanthomonadales bacterium]|nr:DnaJ domain-containing protein [Xanthomonadales bacterium]
MQFHDYYRELGVKPDDSEATIKQAYRRLARKYHPDVSKEADAETRFKAINEAWEVLRDKDRRAAYDDLRAGYRDGQQFRPPPDWNGGGFGAPGEGAGDFSDFFESLFGRGQGRTGGARGRPRKPAALRATLELPLEQVAQGGSQRITLAGRTLDVRIPAGIAAGQTIRLSGQGPDGADVLLEIALAPHPQFEVDGRDLLGRVAVRPWQAALGAEVPVPTLAGIVRLRVPAGTPSGRRLRLKGRGLPGDPPGDHFVRIEIDAPAAASAEQRQAWQALAQAYGEPVDA